MTCAAGFNQKKTRLAANDANYANGASMTIDAPFA